MINIGTSNEQLKVQIPFMLNIESESSRSFKVISNREIEEDLNHEKETRFKEEETLQ